MEYSMDAIDLQYHQFLAYIKPYIINERSNHCMNLFESWVKRINECKSKALRNQYAALICNQLKSGRFEPPFTTLPPPGQLPFITEEDHSSDWSDLAESTVADLASPQKCPSSEKIPRTISPTLPSLPLKSPMIRSPAPTIIKEQQRFPQTITPEKNQNTMTLSLPASECGCSTKKFDEATNLHLTKCNYEVKLSQLQNIVIELSHEKELLARQLEACNSEYARRTDYSANNINHLVSEVTLLRGRLMEASNVEISVRKEQAENVQQWTDKIDELRLKVLNMESTSNAINAALDKSDAKIVEIERKAHEEKEQISEKHKNKLTELHEMFIKEYTKLQDAYKVLKDSEEQKIKQLLEYEESFVMKDKEIAELQTQIQEKCTAMNEELAMFKTQHTSDSKTKTNKLIEQYKCKIVLLQKYVSKCEKNNAKTVRSYEKKMHALSQEIDLHNKALQIQFDMQKASVTFQGNVEKQEEINVIVGELECKYKVLLEDQRIAANCRHLKDQCIIVELKDTISQLRSQIQQSSGDGRETLT